MMSEIIANEFLNTQEKLNSIGFEVIGSQEVNSETIYLVKEK